MTSKLSQASTGASALLVANFVDNDPDLPCYLEALRFVFGESLSVSRAEDSFNYTLFAWKGARRLPGRDAVLARARTLAMTHPLNLRPTARRLKQGERLASGCAFGQTLTNRGND
jgi:spermidine synthase